MHSHIISLILLFLYAFTYNFLYLPKITAKAYNYDIEFSCIC